MVKLPMDVLQCGECLPVPKTEYKMKNRDRNFFRNKNFSGAYSVFGQNSEKRQTKKMLIRFFWVESILNVSKRT